MPQNKWITCSACNRYTVGFDNEAFNKLFCVNWGQLPVFEFGAWELGYEPVFWHFAACMDATSKDAALKNCAMRLRSIWRQLSSSLTLAIQSFRFVISATFVSQASVQSSLSSIISNYWCRASSVIRDFVFWRDTLCDRICAAHVSNVSFVGSRCLPSIWVKTVCSQFIGSHCLLRSTQHSIQEMETHLYEGIESV